MKEQPNSTLQNKKGLSPIVLVLACCAIVIVVLCVYLSGNDNGTAQNNHMPNTPQTNTPSNDDTPAPSDNSIKLPSNTITDTERLDIEEEILTFQSGGYVSYGYPILTLENKEISSKINESLRSLVDSVILPKAHELELEDTPGTCRYYDFRLCISDTFYSIIVTVDIREGITSDYQAFAWSFTKTEGEYFDLYECCEDRYTLSKLIDSHITDTANYDAEIHTWLTYVLETDNMDDGFAYYFHEDMFVAIINKRYRLNSPDRNPILIQIPYSQIQNLIQIP